MAAKRKAKDSKRGDRQDEQTARLQGREQAGKKITTGRPTVSHKRQCAAVRQGSLLSTQLTLAEPKVSHQEATGTTRAVSCEMRAIIYAQCQVIKNHLGQAGKRARIPGGQQLCATLLANCVKTFSIN